MILNHSIGGSSENITYEDILTDKGTLRSFCRTLLYLAVSQTHCDLSHMNNWFIDHNATSIMHYIKRDYSRQARLPSSHRHRLLPYTEEAFANRFQVNLVIIFVS